MDTSINEVRTFLPFLFTYENSWHREHVVKNGVIGYAHKVTATPKPIVAAIAATMEQHGVSPTLAVAMLCNLDVAAEPGHASHGESRVIEMARLYRQAAVWNDPAPATLDTDEAAVWRFFETA